MAFISGSLSQFQDCTVNTAMVDCLLCFSEAVKLSFDGVGYLYCGRETVQHEYLELTVCRSEVG
jgi:hypothetical protein